MPPLVTIRRAALARIQDHPALRLAGARVCNDDGSWMEWESTLALPVAK